MGNKVCYILLFLLISFLVSCELFTEGYGDKVDLAPPGLTVTSHSNGDFAKGAFTLSGEVTDDVGVTSVNINYLNSKGESTTKAAVINNNTWSLSFNPEDNTIPIEGEFELKISAADKENKVTEKKIMLFLDNSMPSLDIQSPMLDQVLNGDVLIGGSANDSSGSGISAIEYRIGYNHESEEWQKAKGGSFNWFIELYGENCIDTYAVEGEALLVDDIWKLPVYIRATDKAGNVVYKERVLNVYPDGDAPKATVFTPDPNEENRTLGGPIRISGRADDDDGVEAVYIQIDTNGDGDYNEKDDPDWLYGEDGNGKLLEGKTNWAIVINEDGTFNPTGSNNTRDINFRIRVKDIHGKLGPWTPSSRIEVDKNVPRIGASSPLVFKQGDLVRLYTKNMWLTGDWILNGPIDDDSGISRVDVSGFVAGALASNSNWFKEIDRGYNLNLGIETSQYGTGRAVLRLIAYDDANPINKTVKNIEFQYDNEKPVPGDYSGILPIYNSLTGGNIYTVGSKITEKGSGLKRVQFYFLRGDKILNPIIPGLESDILALGLEEDNNNGNYYKELTGAARSSLMTVDHSGFIGNEYVKKGGILNIGGSDILIEKVEGSLVTLKEEVPLNITDVKIAYTMVVDYDGVESGLAHDNDGLIERIERGEDNEYTWAAIINSKNMSDGPVSLFIVSEDNAGNIVKHKTIGTVIKNNGPKITKVTLGTDLDADGTIETAEKTSYVVNNSATGSGSFSLRDTSSITLEVEGGNGALFYQINDGVDIPQLPADGNIVLSKEFINSVLSEDQLNTVNITVWDSTDGTKEGDDSLFHKITIPVNVDIVDGNEPKSVIDDFYWNSASDNSLYEKSISNGNIELNLNELGDTDPKVSGKVVIKGSSYDDQRVEAIYLRIDGMPMSSDKTFYGEGYQRMTNFNVSTGLTSNAANFTIVGQNITQEGHEVHWEYDWDSSFLDTVAGLDKNIKVVTVDKGNNSSSNINNITNNIKTGNRATYRVDVVPYITDIKRDSSLYETFRSNLGNYSLRRNQENVEVYGFNLFKYGGSISSSIDGKYIPVNMDNSTKSMLTVKFDTYLTSGYFTVSVNDVNTLNNLNIDKPGVVTDNTYIHIWHGGDYDYFEDSSAPEYPAMSIDPVTGDLHASWSNYPDSATYKGILKRDKRYSDSSQFGKIIYTGYDPMEHTDIHFGSKPTIVYNSNMYGDNIWSQAGAGGVQVWDSAVTAMPFDNTREVDNVTEEINGGLPFYNMEELYHNRKLFQFINQRVVSDEYDNIHISYFDTDSKSLKYSYLKSGDTSVEEHKTWINIDGGKDDDDIGRIVGGDDSRNYTMKAGEYSAIDVDNNGRPHIAYYDITNQRVKLAVAGNVNPSASDWAIYDVTAKKSYTGKYISMKIDSYNNVHLAFYRTSTGDLCYKKITPSEIGSGISPDYEKIDSEGSVGVWADIALENDSPVISYLDSSNSYTFNGLKCAWINNGVWEHVNVPLGSEIVDVRTSVEAFSGDTSRDQLARGWNRVIGYSSGDLYRVVYYIKEVN